MGCTWGVGEIGYVESKPSEHGHQSERLHRLHCTGGIALLTLRLLSLGMEFGCQQLLAPPAVTRLSCRRFLASYLIMFSTTTT